MYTHIFLFANDRNQTRILLIWVLRSAHVNNTTNLNRPLIIININSYFLSHKVLLNYFKF